MSEIMLPLIISSCTLLVKILSINEIQQQINQIEDRYDDIAPCTQNIERQHQAEGDQDLHPEFSGNYNVSYGLGIPSVDNSEPLTMNELQNDEYRHMVQTLNKEQK